MASATDPTVAIGGMALLSAGYAGLGVGLAFVGVLTGRRQFRRVGLSLAVTSPLPPMLFAAVLGALTLAPPGLRRVVWVAVVVGAWLPILLSPPVAVAFLLDR